MAIFLGAIMIIFWKLIIMTRKICPQGRHGLLGCLCQERGKCGSTMKTMYCIKSYGKNKIWSQIMAISFVFMPFFVQKWSLQEVVLYRSYVPTFKFFAPPLAMTEFYFSQSSYIRSIKISYNEVLTKIASLNSFGF